MLSVHLLASHGDRSGGADVYTSELAKKLQSRGYDVTLICYHAADEIRKTCRVAIVNRGRSNETAFIWRFSPILQLPSVERSMRRLNLDQPDVVLGMAHQIIWAHRRCFGPCPLVYLPHSMIAPVEVASYRWGSDIKRRTAVWLWDRLEREAINRAFRTIRFTKRGCEILTSYYGDAVRPRFRVLPPAVELPKLQPRSPTKGPVKLLSVGRLVASKNQRFLLQVLTRLSASNWTLDILGDGVDRPELEGQVKAANLGTQITFHGHVLDPERFYAQADLLVAPSLLENAPLVIVEAMAHGVPSLTIEADGARYLNANRELVTDGHDGFLARDEKEFATRLESLIGTPDALTRAGRCARHTAEQHYTWAAHLDGYDEVLHGAVLAARESLAARSSRTPKETQPSGAPERGVRE